MLNVFFLSLYGPVIIITVALVWGLGRIYFLAKREKVTVLSFLYRRKTPVEIMLGLTAVIFNGYMFLRAFWPELDIAASMMESPAPSLGVLLMASGAGLMIISQINMGKAWRIGVPEQLEKSQTLITTGIYQYSRNPIYVAIMMFLIGGMVTAPGPLTAGCVIFSFFLIQEIIKREEAFLEASFGAEFRTYCQSVRRWF